MPDTFRLNDDCDLDEEDLVDEDGEPIDVETFLEREAARRDFTLENKREAREGR